VFSEDLGSPVQYLAHFRYLTSLDCFSWRYFPYLGTYISCYVSKQPAECGSQNLWIGVFTYPHCLYLTCIISQNLFWYKEATEDWFLLCVCIQWSCPRHILTVNPWGLMTHTGIHIRHRELQPYTFLHISLREKAAKETLLHPSTGQFSLKLDSSQQPSEMASQMFCGRHFFFKGIGGWMSYFKSLQKFSYLGLVGNIIDPFKLDLILEMKSKLWSNQ